MLIQEIHVYYSFISLLCQGNRSKNHEFWLIGSNFLSYYYFVNLSLKRLKLVSFILFPKTKVKQIASKEMSD